MSLPRVYANPLQKEFTNVQKICNCSLNDRSVEEPNLNVKLRKIFDSREFVYKKRIRIKLANNETKEIVLIGKTSDSLLTMDGQRIKINEIYDIEEI
jgi:hypothetical protein